jgi:outer membrane protein/protease secretion system outer membrane protein
MSLAVLSMFIKTRVTPLVLTIACVPTWALDLMQTYQAALTQDVSLQAAQAVERSGRERLPQARAQMGPNLSASISRYHNDLTSTVSNVFGMSQTSQSNYFSSNRTLTLRQPLFRPYQWALYRQAQFLVQSNEATLEKELQSLGVRVSEAYFEALLADDQLALILAQKTTYTTQRNGARKGLAAGSGTRTDIDEAQARLDMTLAQELEARQNQDYTRRQLQVMMNQPVSSLKRLDTGRLPLLAPEPADLQAWVTGAEQNSPEIQSIQAQFEVSRQEVVKAQAAHYPTLDAIAQWSHSESENVLDVQSRYENKSVGLQLSIPLFSSGQVNSTVRQALAEQDRISYLAEALRRDLGLRVNKEYRGVTEGIARVRALEQAVHSAEELVQSSRKAFQSGSRTQFDILNSEQQLMLSLRDLAQARYQYLTSRIRLQALAGGDKMSAIAEVNNWLVRSNETQ